MGDPVTVGAQQREVAEPRAAWAGGVERDDMVALDISMAALSVDLFEVEAAGLARKRSALVQNCRDPREFESQAPPIPAKVGL